MAVRGHVALRSDAKALTRNCKSLPHLQEHSNLNAPMLPAGSATLRECPAAKSSRSSSRGSGTCGGRSSMRRRACTSSSACPNWAALTARPGTSARAISSCSTTRSSCSPWITLAFFSLVLTTASASPAVHVTCTHMPPHADPIDRTEAEHVMCSKSDSLQIDPDSATCSSVLWGSGCSVVLFGLPGECSDLGNKHRFSQIHFLLSAAWDAAQNGHVHAWRSLCKGT